MGFLQGWACHWPSLWLCRPEAIAVGSLQRTSGMPCSLLQPLLHLTDPALRCRPTLRCSNVPPPLGSSSSVLHCLLAVPDPVPVTPRHAASLHLSPASLAGTACPCACCLHPAWPATRVFIFHLHVLLARPQSVPDTVCHASPAARLHLCGGEAAYVRRPPGCAAVRGAGLVPCRQRGQQVGSQVTGSPLIVQRNAVQRKHIARVLLLAHPARPMTACPDQRDEGLVDGCINAVCLHRHTMPERETQLLTPVPPRALSCPLCATLM